jgi:hypothetical protein
LPAERLEPAPFADTLGRLASRRPIEAPVETSAKTITDAKEACLDLGQAFVFQSEDPDQYHAEPIAEPDEQHWPISAMIDPEPKEDEIPEI